MLYGLLPGGKKVRSKILFDIGSIFEVDKKNILQVAAAVEAALAEEEAEVEEPLSYIVVEKKA